MLGAWHCSGEETSTRPSGSPPVALRRARAIVRHRLPVVGFRSTVRHRLLSRSGPPPLQPTRVTSGLAQRGPHDFHGLSLSSRSGPIRADGRAPPRPGFADQPARRGPGPAVESRSSAPAPDHPPGLGPFIVLVRLLEVDDLHRFPKATPGARSKGWAPPRGPRPRRDPGLPPTRPGAGVAPNGPAPRKTPARVALARRRAELVYRAGRPISTTGRSWGRGGEARTLTGFLEGAH